MPMVPSPVAALAYGAVKLGGYAYFSMRLNVAVGASVRPYKFGLAKTVIGLVGGIAYLFALSRALPDGASDLVVFLGAIPVRITAWTVALWIFYGFKHKPRLVALAVLIGTAWSYMLDGIMWALYKLLPGMVMPFC
jgi:hypothetical protein